MKRTALARKPHADSPYSTMPPRAKRIAASSTGQRTARVQQQRVYQQTPEDGWCAACGRSGLLLDHSHILTQGRHEAHRNNPLNWLMLCRYQCHPMWEHNKAKFKATYPLAFAEKMRRMQLLDRQAYAFFMMKNPTLFPPQQPDL